MYVIDVIALSPSSPAAPLSYRSKEKLAPGTIVSILLRKTPVHGIVVGATEVKDAKAMLKTASFALVKSVTRTDGMMPKPLLLGAEHIARYHAVPLGAVLHAILSDSLANDIPRVLTEGPGHELRSLEFPRDVRFRKYRSEIEGLKHKRATLLVCPTMAELAEAKVYFKDLEPIVLSGEVKADVRKELLNEAAQTTKLVITTPAFSFVSIKALGLTIIERPSAGSYRMQRRPYLDIVASQLLLAQNRDIPAILGDYPLPLEYRARPMRPLQTSPKGSIEAVDVRKEKAQGEAWSALPESTLRVMRTALKDNGRVVVLAARKGYAPAVVCRDCGTTLKDAQGRAYSLASVKGTRIFRTADGTSTLSTDIRCPVCDSWNLLPLGIAVERVFEELKAAFPDTPIQRFDTDTVRTDVQARKAMRAFRDARGILVGTESMLPWLPSATPSEKPIDLAVVASMDSFLSLPFWRARERFVRIGLMLRDLALHTIIHTRLPDDTALSTVISPTEDGFFKEEASLREALRYPPYGTLIAFRVEGGKKRLLEAKIELIEAVMPHALTVLPERLVEKSTYRMTALLHLPKGVWPDAELSNRLQALPPYMKIAIDPESFW